MKKSIINNNMWILRRLIYFWLFICIFSLLFSLVNAGDTITIMDIQKGDLNAINWNDVPTKYIPFVPASKLPYDKLMSSQRKEMTVEQIIAGHIRQTRIFTCAKSRAVEKNISKRTHGDSGRSRARNTTTKR